MSNQNGVRNFIATSLNYLAATSWMSAQISDLLSHIWKPSNCCFQISDFVYFVLGVEKCIKITPGSRRSSEMRYQSFNQSINWLYDECIPVVCEPDYDGGYEVLAGEAGDSVG